MRSSIICSFSILAALAYAVPHPAVEERSLLDNHAGSLNYRDTSGDIAIQKRSALVNSPSPNVGRNLVERAGLSGGLVTENSPPDIISALQQLLSSHGFTTAVDGQMGPNTRSATGSFQSSVGLDADGVAGPQTLGALVSTVQQGSSGGTVKAAQYALNGNGASLDVDGVFGDGTRAAAVKFQASKGLEQDGIIGPNTWAALFSGGGGGGSGTTNPPGGGGDGFCRGVNDAGIALLQQWEGYRADVYEDTNGYGTIGYGHLCRQTGCSEIPYSIPLSEADAVELMKSDAASFQPCMASKLATNVVLNDNQWAALTSFAFNLGCGSDFTDVANKINAATPETLNQVVADELKWYRLDNTGHLLQGLVNRRAAETALFQTPSDKQAFPKCT